MSCKVTTVNRPRDQVSCVSAPNGASPQNLLVTW
jgi:hypothetical protein